MEKLTVMEIVIAFYGGDSFIILQVRSDEVEHIINEIRNEVEEFLTTKISKFYRVNHLCGFADMRIDLIGGVYTRAANSSTVKAFQEKIIELTKRQVEATEKMVDDNGDEWKK